VQVPIASNDIEEVTRVVTNEFQAAAGNTIVQVNLNIGNTVNNHSNHGNNSNDGNAQALPPPQLIGFRYVPVFMWI
jgi:hypothetical protein